MRDPARIDMIIEQLRELWKKSPDMRFYQLVENITCTDPGVIPFRIGANLNNPESGLYYRSEWNTEDGVFYDRMIAFERRLDN